MIHCKNCKEEIGVERVLEGALFSWPLLKAVWYECYSCGTGNHLRFEDGQIQRIEITGAPGPSWEIVEQYSEKEILVRDDPAFLHVWYRGRHYEVEERK